ncbi:MAG TPA: hypothetical protein VIG24_16685, partial [Acidimicrobiia bacterium]
MFMRTSTSARSHRTSLRISVIGVAAATLVGSSLIFVPTASAVTYTCNDDDATLSSDNTYCEVVFTADASWTVPEGVDEIDALLVGGGGGGGGGATGDGNWDHAGGGGGGEGGEIVLAIGYAPTPGDSVAVDIGGGGAGGSGGIDDQTYDGGISGQQGGDGEETSLTDTSGRIAQAAGGSHGAAGLGVDNDGTAQRGNGGGGNDGAVGPNGQNGAGASTIQDLG